MDSYALESMMTETYGARSAVNFMIYQRYSDLGLFYACSALME